MNPAYQGFYVYLAPSSGEIKDMLVYFFAILIHNRRLIGCFNLPVRRRRGWLS